MDTEILKKLENLEAKIDAIYVSTEQTRKYFFWTMVLTVVVFVVPLIGLMFVIPTFISSYTAGMEGLM